MKKFFNHLKRYIFRGFFAMIPLVITILVMQFVYILVDKRAAKFLSEYIGYTIPGLGLLLVIAVLYLVGLITSNFIGKGLLSLVENITTRIPFIKTIYQIGQQLSFSLSLPEKQVFKKVVLVSFRPGISTLGFVTGSIVDKRTNEEYYKVLIPTAPNPTSGFLFFIKVSEAKEPDLTIEDALKMVISGGIISSETFKINS